MKRKPTIWLRISIHAPREGGDGVLTSRVMRPTLFQSTPPARGATPVQIGVVRLEDISIHAPREGGDTWALCRARIQRKFQSTPPARGATISGNNHNDSRKFQSTPPARGATDC